MGLQAHSRLRDAKVTIKAEDIAEVNSKDHVLMQCLDIVLGAMAFRLNDKHKEKIAGTARRGRKTRAKEALYKTIREEICTLRPNFNCGSSTGGAGDNPIEHWNAPYRHWSFVPKDGVIEPELFKPQPTNKKRAPN